MDIFIVDCQAIKQNLPLRNKAEIGQLFVRMTMLRLVHIESIHFIHFCYFSFICSDNLAIFSETFHLFRRRLS